MKTLHYLFGYIKFDTRELRIRASKEARAWLVSQGRATPHYPDSYRIEYQAFARAYATAELHVKSLEYANAYASRQELKKQQAK